MSWWQRYLHPGQFPGLRLGERHVQDLLKARQNPLPKYRLARVVLQYAPDKEAALSTVVKEIALEDALAGTALERQTLVDLVQDLADMAAARPGVYSIVMFSASLPEHPGGYAFGTIVSESIPTPSVGSSSVGAPSPTAPVRIVLAAVADVWKEARAAAERKRIAAAEARARRLRG